MNGLRVLGVIAVAAAGAVTASAEAAIIPVTMNLTPEGPNFRLTYRVDLQGSGRIDGVGTPGADPAYFTIYDFAGFVPGTNVQPAGWDFSYQFVGVTPQLVTPPDDALLYNLTWRYTGTSTIGAGLNNETTLGLFSAVTRFSMLNELGAFAAATTKDSRNRFEDGTPLHNVGFVAVPSSESPGPSVVPEPGSLALLGMGGVGLLGGAIRARRRKRAA